MTDTEAEALGKRIVACKGFRPMRGMLDMQGRTWDQSLLWRWDSTRDVPELRDPATLGCVLALVREAWRDPYMHPERWLSCSEDWTLRHYETRENEVWFDGDEWTSKTQAGVLVAALEDAP